MGNEKCTQPSLVDQYYEPFLRPLGMLVILSAQCEEAVVDYLAALSNEDELGARERFKRASEWAAWAKEELAKTGFQERDSFHFSEINKTLDAYPPLLRRRARLMHDEWFAGIYGDGTASEPYQLAVTTRGAPRTAGATLQYNHPSPDEIMDLAEAFREQRSLLQFAAQVIRDIRAGSDS